MSCIPSPRSACRVRPETLSRLIVLAGIAWIATGCSIVIEAPVADPNSPASAQAAAAPYERPASIFAHSPEPAPTPTAGHDAHDHSEHAAPPSNHAGHSTDPEPVASELGFTCPMHPEIHQHEPGKCPKCGMALVAKKRKKEAEP